MELKDLVGEGYKEGMTIEEVAAAIKNKSLVDPSTLPPSVSRETFDKTAAELAELKKEKKSRMTEDEQAQAKQQEILERMAALEKENTRMKQEKSFLAAGYDPDTAGKLAEHISNGDMETFVKAQSAWAQKLETEMYAKAKQDLLKSTPRICSDNGNGENIKSAAVAYAEAKGKEEAENIARQEKILSHFLKQG